MRIVIIIIIFSYTGLSMYICVCKGVTDRQIQIAIENGVNTRKKLNQCLGVGSDCGKCFRQVNQLLDSNSQVQPIMRDVV